MKESVRTNATETRGLLISKRWVQAVAIVMLFGFFVLGLLAYRTYTDQAPIPGKVVRPDGQVLFTRADVIAGQEIFLRNGLMEYGSIFGHGAYLGPDFTADYLRRWALLVAHHDGGSGSEFAKADTVTTFKTNQYDPITPISLVHPQPNMAFVPTKSLTRLKSGNSRLSSVGRRGWPRHCARDAITPTPTTGRLSR